MGLHSEPLDQEDQDTIILDARAGDLDSLKDIFTTLVSPELLSTCKESESDSTALHMAAANGHIETVRYILETVSRANSAEDLKAFVNEVNKTGNTALHWASLNGKLDVVKLLCDEYEADPFIRNKFGHDAIFEAENSGKEEVETYFLKKYDVEPEDDEEDTQTEGKNSVQITKGKEIEQVTKEATEALREETEKLNINKD
ncbi:Yar1p [Saccharomyces cerevisiae YJM693]|nr:Yar1p [Saccharomyces cerevisiae YJM693]